MVIVAALVVGFGRLARSSDAASPPVRPNLSPSGVAAIESGTATESAPDSHSTDGPSGTVTTRHYISNTGTDLRAVASLGFDLFDTGSDKAYIDALGPGQQALVWLGNLDNTNCRPGYSWDEFQSAVRRLANDPKVFGYFLSDEPHPSVCPNAVRDIRQRADFIRTQDPRQKSFIVVMDADRICGATMGCEYRQLNPANTHVDLIGIDPFPCRIGAGCDPLKIGVEVQRALDGGIGVNNIVPVFQVFGQACSPKTTKFYRQPTAHELTVMLGAWAALVPNPAFDYTYTWRSEGPACPSLDRSSGDAGLQSVMRVHNGG